MLKPITALKSILQGWRYSADTRRDLRLDLLRGYCVAVMTIDHIGLFPAWTLAITGDARLWVTAAEGFILIAGIVFGLLYSRFTQELGWPLTLGRVGRRAAQLYASGVIGALILASSDYVLHLTRGLVTQVPENYFELVQNALFQTQQTVANFQILPLYALLLPWGLLMLYLLQTNKKYWALLSSLAVWYAARLHWQDFRIMSTYFNFASWQLLFVLGLFIGYFRRQIGAWWSGLPLKRLRSIVLMAVGLAVLMISYQVIINKAWPELIGLRNNPAWFGKRLMAPGRIIATLLAFAGLYEWLTLMWRPIQKLLGWLLIPIGQHALIAFVLQAFVAYGVLRLPGWPFPDHDPVVMGWIHIALLLLVYAATRIIASVLSRSKSKLRRSQPA